LYGAETLTLQKADQKYPKDLKCGAREGWRSVEPIVREMKIYYRKSRRRATSHKQ
jgi:hypothetical protein